ncbi:MAG: hypothetical protein C4547_15875 [Phycisphaerales bacterium]|nr:MAG: hypothetical protein C4547_15875 [Phycisphaerales bacterium]
MEPDSLIQLAASGNVATVEDEWMRMLERARDPGDVARYSDTLKTLAGKDRGEEARALAWAALESMESRFEAQSVIAAASPLLLAVPDNPELRQQAAELVRKHYAGRPGIEALIREAGLEGGRPLRRALRTLDVCLRLEPGSFAAGRDEDRAARIEAIDPADWTITFSDGAGTRTLDPVRFADAYCPVQATDFRVLRRFDAAALAAKLQKEPASLIVSLLKIHGHQLNSDELEAILVPDLIPAGQWKKWFTRARNGLKRVPQVTVEGRSPYFLKYDATQTSIEEQFFSEFEGRHDALDKWSVVERYVRECKQHKSEPDRELLTRFHAALQAQARRRIESGARAALRDALIAYQSGRLVGSDESTRVVHDLLASIEDLESRLVELDVDALTCAALDCLRDVHPDSWRDVFLSLLPLARANVCEHIAEHLVGAGYDTADFEPAIERILAAPADHFEALLWLWNGPRHEARVCRTPLVTILMRLMGVLADLRRDDTVESAVLREYGGRARTALSARNYSRFEACLKAMDLNMAVALKSRLPRLEMLGDNVCDDLSTRINRAFPSIIKKKEIEPWLREDVLYVTQKGMTRRRSEIDEIVNVKLKENARAIGEAASKGDLSENAEYKFALEERDLLRGRLAMMQEEMGRVQVIDPAEVPTDYVGIGSKVRLRLPGGGEALDLSIVDPWISDVERHLYNYRTPLAQALLGRRVGDSAELNVGGVTGVYQIEAIESALPDL